MQTLGKPPPKLVKPTGIINFQQLALKTMKQQLEAIGGDEASSYNDDTYLEKAVSDAVKAKGAQWPEGLDIIRAAANKAAVAKAKKGEDYKSEFAGGLHFWDPNKTLQKSST